MLLFQMCTYLSLLISILLFSFHFPNAIFSSFPVFLHYNRVELREVLSRYGQAAHKFFNLQNYALFLSFRDPMSFVDCPSAQEDSITVTPRKGNTKVWIEIRISTNILHG